MKYSYVLWDEPENYASWKKSITKDHIHYMTHIWLHLYAMSRIRTYIEKIKPVVAHGWEAGG